MKSLDSRQRKKQHTERLEEEKKHLSNVISSLQEQIALLTREKDCLRDRWTAEKDEMIRTHTLETGELRKKIDVLTTEQLQRLESPRVSARTNVPEADFANPYGGLYPTGRPPGGWANSDSMQDVFPSEQQQRQQEAHAPAKKLETPQAPETEKGASQGGLLFMLLLVGAFVMSSRSMPALSSVSDDVRVASASILDHVLQDAELDGAHTNKQAGAPQPSVAGWVPPAVTIAGTTDTNMDEDAPSMLEQLGDSLVQPSREQTNEQIFSLSAAQYDGVNSHDYLQNTPERCVSQERKSISQALAAARAVTKQDSSADVYTRTLHPKHVIDKFARIVARLNSVHTSSNATKHDDNDDSTTIR